jgi:hypothetical protein
MRPGFPLLCTNLCMVLIQTAYRQASATMLWRSLGLRLGEAAGGITMTEVLNEVDLGEPDQSAPSSDIALRVSGSQKTAPSPSALEDRDRRYELRARQSLTAAFFGDPPPGRSALDRQRAEQERIARQRDIWR